jgi:hypothetical protein
MTCLRAGERVSCLLAELGEDGQAWWVCPSDRRLIAPIGRFEADAS